MKTPRLIIGSLVALVLFIGLGVAWFSRSDDGEFFGPADDDGDLAPEAVAVLDAPDSFYLYSLHPEPFALRPQTPQEATNEVRRLGENYHGFEILGRVEVVDPVQRKELVDALKQGVSEGKGPAPACFNPRHGIRAMKGGVTVDLVICFECISMNEVMTSSRSLRISHSPQETFTRALKRTNLPLPPD